MGVEGDAGRLQGGGISLPLCVDLDGTLVRTDTLVESWISVVRQSAASLLLSPFWLLSGKAAFKHQVARRASLDPALLPYNRPFVEYLKAEKESGRRIILATAADGRIAEGVALHLDMFDRVVASDADHNLRGAAKAEALCREFGEKRFAYAGNARSDLSVWAVSSAAVLVNAPRGLSRRVAIHTPIEKTIEDRKPFLGSFLQAARPHQWLKNILVFVPIVTSGSILNIDGWFKSFMLFLAFCCAASGTYIVNDIMDLRSDRRHPGKRGRPFASGDFPIAAGLALAPLLLLVGFALANAVMGAFYIAAYMGISLAYSWRFKEYPLVDVFTLAGLYTIRLFAGGAVTGHAVSLWLLAFSSFLFVSLAIMKRVIEIKRYPERAGYRRRGYAFSDQGILEAMGVAATFASGIVLALYVQSEGGASKYLHHLVLWMIVPLMLFWQCRLWLSTTRGYVDDDPVAYAARDWVTWLVVLAVLVIMGVSRYPF